MRLKHLVVMPVLAVALFGCGSSSSGKTVKDQAGRTCTIPDTGLTLKCDRAPEPHAPCTVGASPCFVKGVGDTPSAAVIGPSAVCAACCSGNSATSTGGDCSPIVCKTVGDCPDGDTKCDNGLCY